MLNITGTFCLTSFQIEIMCILSLSNMVPRMATQSKSSSFKAWWSSGHLTSALTLKTKCVQILRFDLAMAGPRPPRVNNHLCCYLNGFYQDDKMFTFRFNLVVMRNDVEVSYALSETCSPSLPWSPREVTCEANYMEVRLTPQCGFWHWLMVFLPRWMSRVKWPVQLGQTKMTGIPSKWCLMLQICVLAVCTVSKMSFLKAHSSTTSDWQVTFQQGEQQHSPMTLSEASKQGYIFYLTDGRLVFRTPYGQPHSFNTEVNVQTLNVFRHLCFFKIVNFNRWTVFQWKWSMSPYIQGKAGWCLWSTWWRRAPWVSTTIFSFQDFSQEMVLNPAFLPSLTDEGSPDGDHMVWETPDMLYPSFSVVEVSVGLNGQLLEQPAAEKRGYTVQKNDSKFQISVPFDADGRYRKVRCKVCFGVRAQQTSCNWQPPYLLQSFVNGSLFDFYVFHLYFEQILLDEDQVETRLRLHRTMTAVVQCPVFTENRKSNTVVRFPQTGI